MTTQNLSKEEYLKLCQRYITEHCPDREQGASSPSYLDLALADELVNRQVIENDYNGVEFVTEDFFCNI